MSQCSVIMVSYHTGSVLFMSVKSVLRQKNLAELILVDNGNPPDVLARLQQIALTEPRLKIITGGGNVGFSRACNVGAKHTTGEFLLLLNPDCLLPPEALVSVMQGFEEIPGATLAGCFLRNPDGSEQRGGRRRLLTPISGLSEILCAFPWLGCKRMNLHKTPMPNHTHEVPAISGAFMCLRKRDFIKLGGMDEGYFLHVEDMDLCMRVHRTGGKVICVPHVRVTHMLSTSGHTTSRALEWQKTKGFLRYFTKHFQRTYVPGFLLVINAAVLLRFALKMLFVLARIHPRGSGPDLSNSNAYKRLMVLASGLVDLPVEKHFYGKTVLVTGATSQVGLFVIRRLIAQGAAVLALSRHEEIPFEHEHLRWIKGDLSKEDLHLEGYLVDIVIHCTHLWYLPALIKTFAGAEAKRIIAFGSTSIFGKATSKNINDIAIVDKLQKAEAGVHEQSRLHHIDCTILRSTLIYGAGLDKNITSAAKFIDRFRFFPIYPPGFGRRQPVHTDDLATAALQALGTPQTYGKSYNVSGAEVITYRQMIERIFAVCNRPVRIVQTTLLPFLLDVAGKLLRKPDINGEIARRMNDDLMFFHDDAKRDFGFHPRPFLSGGKKDIEGY